MVQKINMALRGVEPPTPRLRVWCSNQAELQSHCVCYAQSQPGFSFADFDQAELQSLFYEIIFDNKFKKL